MYTNNPFELDEFHEGRMLERDRVLTELMGDYETAERESADPERYVSEADYDSDLSDIVEAELLAIFQPLGIAAHEIGNLDKCRAVIRDGLAFYSTRLRWF